MCGAGSETGPGTYHPCRPHQTTALPDYRPYVPWPVSHSSPALPPSSRRETLGARRAVLHGWRGRERDGCSLARDACLLACSLRRGAGDGACARLGASQAGARPHMSRQGCSCRLSTQHFYSFLGPYINSCVARVPNTCRAHYYKPLALQPVIN